VSASRSYIRDLVDIGISNHLPPLFMSFVSCMKKKKKEKEIFMHEKKEKEGKESKYRRIQ
jgi:hypothetical protein